VDTGPLVALFDPADAAYGRCVEVLQAVAEPLVTTTPVLTEAFHLLTPSSVGAQRLMDFVVAGGVSVRYMDDEILVRAFQLMLQYEDMPMDLADASLVATAELEDIRKIFTVDRRDSAAYRVRRGHRLHAMEILG
jgi:predicted nucleic acid-binding protein